MGSQSDLLEIRELGFARNGSMIFANIHCRIESGTVLLIKGNNGSGKTTLLRTICGLHKASCGEVIWRGRPLSQRRDDYSDEILFCGHQNGLLADLSVREILTLRFALANLPLYLDDCLQQLCLENQRDNLCRDLSAGQRQRLSLAILLHSKARIWLLDEPFVALDAQAQRWVGASMHRHLNAGGLLLLASHQPLAELNAPQQILHLGK